MHLHVLSQCDEEGYSVCLLWHGSSRVSTFLSGVRRVSCDSQPTFQRVRPTFLHGRGAVLTNKGVPTEVIYCLVGSSSTTYFGFLLNRGLPFTFVSSTK